MRETGAARGRTPLPLGLGHTYLSGLRRRQLLHRQLQHAVNVGCFDGIRVNRLRQLNRPRKLSCRTFVPQKAPVGAPLFLALGGNGQGVLVQVDADVALLQSRQVGG